MMPWGIAVIRFISVVFSDASFDFESMRTQPCFNFSFAFDDLPFEHPPGSDDVVGTRCVRRWKEQRDGRIVFV